MAILILSTIIPFVAAGNMFAYGSNNQNDNDPRNQACYNAGFGDARQNNPYNQNMFNQCGINGRAYYEGFLSGCISGQGKDYFSCQKLTNAPIGGGGSGSSSGSGGSSSSGSGQGGGGGFGGSSSSSGQGGGGGFGGSSSSSGQGGGGGGGFNGFGGSGGGNSQGGGGGGSR
jgi:hypothetical protein